MESTSENIEAVYFTKSIEYYSYLLDTNTTNTFLIKNGELWGTGSNFVGQLGLDNNNANVDVLTRINIPDGKTARYISAGGAHTIVLMQDGSIYGTGSNNFGQLGLGDAIGGVSVLTRINIPDGKTARYISVGSSPFEAHTIVLMQDGSIYGTGRNLEGQLGLVNVIVGGSVNVLTLINIPDGKTARYISAGGSHTIVLMQDGSIYGTGRNLEGQLGLDNNNANVSVLTPINIPDGKTARYISAGGVHTIVLMQDGSIYGTGSNLEGQLGLDNAVNVLTLINIPDGKTARYISAGGFHTIVLMQDGSIYGTGRKLEGQLGLDNNNAVNVLTLINIPDGKTARYISAGGSHTIVLMQDGSIYGTGSNNFGQLGLGDAIGGVNVLTPMPNAIDVTYITGMEYIFSIMIIGYKRIQFSG
jgi:alpha-tubulin suppressor-like RCC1 family protein